MEEIIVPLIELAAQAADPTTPVTGPIVNQLAPLIAPARDAGHHAVAIAVHLTVVLGEKGDEIIVSLIRNPVIRGLFR
jgi:hypothetical protein